MLCKPSRRIADGQLAPDFVGPKLVSPKLVGHKPIDHKPVDHKPVGQGILETLSEGRLSIDSHPILC